MTNAWCLGCNEPGGVTHAYSQGPALARANDLANPRNNNPLCGKYFHDTILICVFGIQLYFANEKKIFVEFP